MLLARGQGRGHHAGFAGMLVFIHRPLASLIRVTEDAEINIFSIAVERTAMEKHSAAYAAEMTKGINSLVLRCQ